MSASEEGQVNSNYPAQDKKFQANPAHDVWIQKSLSSDRVAPVKQLELVERMIGCSGGMVKDQPGEVMSASEEGQVNLNYPDQDKKFQAYPAHDLQSQKSFSSDRVAPDKELEELVDRTIGCSGGMVKDQPSLSYEHTVDSELPLKLQTGEYHVVSTHKSGSSYFLEAVNLLHNLLKLLDTSTSLSSKEALESFQRLIDVFMKLVAGTEEDTAKTSLSSQEASESSQGLQQDNIVLGHKEEGTLPEHVAVYVKPNKDQKYVPTDSDEEQDSHEKHIMKTCLGGQLFVHGDMEPLMHLWIREGKKSIPSTYLLAGKLYHSLVCAHVVEELLRRKKQTGDYDRESRKTDLKGYPPSERMLASLKSRIREGLRNLKMHLDYCHTRVSTNYSCEDQSRAVNLNRCLGLLQLVKQILDKERSNKSIIDIIDITLVKTLVDKSNQLTETNITQKTDSLAADRRHKEAYATYAAVRESFGNIRRNVEQWRDTVLHSVVPWFKEGAYNRKVRKLMNRGLARFGKGGNGELVEAFQSGERLAIKQTMLRESEWSIVTQMDHPNVMPWLALICGDRSDTKPGQIVSYQVMPKMTEDLSAAIRKMGGSIHHYILQLQEAEEPNSVLSAKADLVRDRSAEILRGTLQGLDYMHRQNLVHRDIKASNILLKRPVDCPHEAVHTCTCQERWEVKVADFDSVIHLSVARDRAQRRKQLKVGNTGTSGYRAPEVFFESCTSDIDAKDYYSPASDIWSFGAVCLHLAMGFCCPRHQYQVGLIMLARHNLVNIPAEEAQEKVDRTVGMYHIRQGFNGEKWQNMINFTARPLEVDWSKRPSAETLLKDQFVKPATTLHSSQTGAKNMNERLNRPQTHRPPTSPPNDESSKESGHIPVQPPSGTEAAAVSDASPSKKTLQGLQKPLQSSANAKEEGVQEAKNPSTPPLTSDESVLGGRRCSSISEDQRQEGHGNHDRDAGRQGVGRGSSSQTPECSSSGNIKSSSSPEDNRCTSSVEVEEAGDKPSLLEPHQADRMYDKIGQALPAETYQVVASPTIQTLLAQSTYQTVQVLALQAFQELHSTESKTVESDDIGVVRLQKGDRRSSAESSVSSTCTYVSDQSTPPPELHQPIPPQQNDCVEVPAVCHLSSHHSTSEGEQLVEQEEATNGGMPGGVLVAGSTPLVQCTAGFTELVVSSSSSSARYRNVVGLPTVCTVCKIKEHYKHDSDDEDSEKKKKKAMD